MKRERAQAGDQILASNSKLIAETYDKVQNSLPFLELRVGQVQQITRIPRDSLTKWAKGGVIGRPYKSEHRVSLADIRKAVFLDLLISDGRVTENDCLRIFGQKDARKTLHRLMASSAPPAAQPSLEDEGLFLHFYNYIVPRLVEACYILRFGEVRSDVSLVIEIPDASVSGGSRALIAAADGRRVLTTFHAAAPLKDAERAQPIRETGYAAYWWGLAAPDENRESAGDKREALAKLVDWIERIAARRETTVAASHYATVHPTDYDTIASRCPQMFVDWLVEQGNARERRWSFAVILRPSGGLSVPRYRQEMRTFICSEGGPYHNNPYTISNQGYSQIAFELGHLINPGRIQPGSVYPEQYEKDVTSLVAVPTLCRNQINGVLYVASKAPGHEFSPADELTLAIMARIAGELISDVGADKSRSRELENAISRPRVVNPVFYSFQTKVDWLAALKRAVEKVLDKSVSARSIGLIAVDINRSKSLLTNEDSSAKLRADDEVDRFFRDVGLTLKNEVDRRDERPIFQTKLDRFIVQYESIDADALKREIRRIIKRFDGYVYDDAHVLPRGAITDVRIRLGAVLADAEHLHAVGNCETAIGLLENDLATALKKAKTRMYEPGDAFERSLCCFVHVPDEDVMNKTDEFITATD